MILIAGCHLLVNGGDIPAPAAMLFQLLCRGRIVGSVEKVGVEPNPKRVGPASWNLEYG